MILDVEKIAKQMLTKYGIRWSNLFNEKTGEIYEDAAKKLNLINPVLLHNAKLTIARLDKSANKAGINFTRNLENTIVGTLKAVVMEDLRSKEKKNSPTLVRIVPSSAKEPDAYHARFYGKVMSLEAALEIGITLRYGCQCGLKILSNENRIKEEIK